MLEQSGIRLDREAYDAIPEDAVVRPLRDHILVRPLEWRPSAVIEVAGSTRKPLRGVVVAVGPGHYPKKYNADRSKTWDSKAFQRTECKVGDTIELGQLYDKDKPDYQYAFPQVYVGNVLHLMCREADVCGIVK